MKISRKRGGRPYYQIAVPTDFSPASTSAMKFAQNLARVPGTRVTAVHTIDSLEYSFGPKDLRELKKQQVWALAQESMARWLQEGGFSTVGKSMIEGEAAPAIAQFIAANAIDLIVLSTSARLRAARIAFGSVAEEIFRKAACPVFVLGPKVRAQQPAFDAVGVCHRSGAAFAGGLASSFDILPEVRLQRVRDPRRPPGHSIAPGTKPHQKTNRREDKSRG